MLIDLKPEQVDYLIRLLASEEDGAAEFVAGIGYRHLDGDVNHAHDLIDHLAEVVSSDPPLVTAYVAEIDDFDGLYLFEREQDRDAFVKARCGLDVEDTITIATGDSPINSEASAKRLISAEQRERIATELLANGWPNVAADVADGQPADVILKRLSEIGEGASEAYEIIAAAGLDD